MQSDTTFHLRQLVFRSDCDIEIQGEKILLSLNDDYVVLQGQMGAALVDVLREGATPDDIVESLSAQYPSEELYFLLMRLEQDGFLTESVPEEKAPFSNFWTSMGYLPGQVVERLDKRSITVHEIGIPDDLGIAESLHDMQAVVEDTASRCLLLVSDYLHPELRELDRRSKEQMRHYLLARPVGPVLWLGPIIHSLEASCWHCLKQSLELNRPSHVYKSEQGASIYQAKGYVMPDAVSDVARGFITLETIKWLVSEKSSKLENTLLSFDLRTLEITEHPCLHRPQCPNCGSGSMSSEPRIALGKPELLLKRAFNFRVVSKEDTLKKYERLVSPVTGVIRSLTRVQAGPEDIIHNYTVSHGGRLSRYSIESLRLATRDRSGGKGTSNVGAKVSGLCEALERYSAIFANDPIQAHESYIELDDGALHPNELLLFSEKQYANRERWNSEQSGRFQFVPLPFDESAVIDWTAAWSLTQDEPRYIPSAYCYYGIRRGRKCVLQS